MRSTGHQTGRLRITDLLTAEVTAATLEGVDCVFVGGSGAYSATETADWADKAMRSLQAVHAAQVPTFASCWGHQAFARAMGGLVRRTPDRAEVGTLSLRLTDAAAQDPIFGALPNPMLAQVGHEDSVVELPPNSTLLAGTTRCPIHAYRFDDAPIYCTQFHPELNTEDLIKRLERYPSYVENITGQPIEEFLTSVADSPDANDLIRRFVAAHVR